MCAEKPSQCIKERIGSPLSISTYWLSKKPTITKYPRMWNIIKISPYWKEEILIQRIITIAIVKVRRFKDIQFISTVYYRIRP